MDHQFWRDRWEEGQIGFHEGKPNDLLVAHLAVLGLASGARIFVPLCGKAHDLGWLVAQGYRVVGAELSEIAVRDLFAEQRLEPTIEPAGDLIRYSAGALEVFVGDVFALDTARLGPVDAVFDRAAFVALPDDLRTRYAAHIPETTGNVPQLMITFEYDQTVMPGPPFAIAPDEVARRYGAGFTVTELARRNVEGKLKGQTEADEIIWHLGARG